LCRDVRFMRRVERPLAALAVIGDVVLDLRGAEVPQGQVFISATAVMGDVKVHVPDGVDVRLSGIAVMGDKVVKVREAAPGQKVPTVVVKATAVMGDVRSSVTPTGVLHKRLRLIVDGHCQYSVRSQPLAP
jgi:hypothetical protein